MSELLKPCPFCGGDAELDTQQGYRALGTGRTGTRIVVYCRNCGADQGICREDVPDIEPTTVIEMWNRRAHHDADGAATGDGGKR
jgi:Lar family restriction alleviation protein